MSDPFLIFGHRGSPGRFPENTLASFDEAIRSGADGFETDLRLLSDQTAILYHDDEWAGQEIETLSSMDLNGRTDLVRLSDLAAYAGKTTMILEVKRSKWEDVLLEHVTGWASIVIASFDHSIIRELARRNLAIQLGITMSGSIVGIAPYAAGLGATWCFPDYRYVDHDMVSSLHGESIRVVPWTVNRPRDWDRLRTMGCDGVITDVPAEAVAWRD